MRAVEVADSDQVQRRVAERVAQWHGHSAEIIAHIDDPDLPALLDRSLQVLVPHDASVVFAYPNQAAPLFLHDGFRGHTPRAALDAYNKGVYRLDPFYIACARNILPGLYSLQELAPEDFFHSGYFHSPEMNPCASAATGPRAQQAGFMVRLPAGFMAAYSLLRDSQNAAFSAEDLAVLRLVEPVIRQAVAHRWRDLRQ